MDLLQDIRAALTPHGLNLIGTATVAAYEALVPVQYHVAALLPQAKTVVVICNGGGRVLGRTPCVLSRETGISAGTRASPR